MVCHLGNNDIDWPVGGCPPLTSHRTPAAKNGAKTRGNDILKAHPPCHSQQVGGGVENNFAQQNQTEDYYDWLSECFKAMYLTMFCRNDIPFTRNSPQ